MLATGGGRTLAHHCGPQILSMGRTSHVNMRVRELATSCSIQAVTLCVDGRLLL